MVDLLQKRDVAVSVCCDTLYGAQLAILNETLVRLAPEAFEHFMAAIDAPVLVIPAKLAERLARQAPWDETSVL